LRSTLDIPVIARVNGHALGGGFEMMLGCDLVVAAAEASFGLPEPRVGLLPLDGGMVLLQRQVAFRQAMGVLLTGRRFSAAEAQSWGLVHQVHPGTELAKAVREYADMLARKPTRPLAEMKARINTIARTGVPEVNAMTEGFLDRE